jgi:hemerythrin-like domain-containing protein
MNIRGVSGMERKFAPLAVLAGEHRLIERMLALMAKERDAIRSGGTPRVPFIRDALDFFRVYADLCHHAKEERSLFRAIGEKALSPEDRSALDAFVADHIEERKWVFCLKTHAERFAVGERNAAGLIGNALDGLIRHASDHMAREEKIFLHAFVLNVNKRDADRILSDFHECDADDIQDKYRRAVERHELIGTEEAREVVLSAGGGNWYIEDHVLQASAG